ncbi:glycosyltransferase family 2 protein [Thalassobellus citreus]|uniref:glycosyltransferase family 2 protein n=1 Tax=Thalassobellus citreus TaxID=3367752 RepID=UPI003790BDF6
MQATILIVSKNRKEELKYTLDVLYSMISLSVHEVLIFLDGCIDNSEALIKEYEWVKWYVSNVSIGASAARQRLYKNAKGDILIGLDDDAHPLHNDFIERTSKIFELYPNVGIIAYRELKGIFCGEKDIENKLKVNKQEYYTKEFIGCGFAIRKDVYEETRGFPVWIDIYGEESCVSVEVIENGYDILFSNRVTVNHRVDIVSRKLKRQNYFRFGKQLKNSAYYYMVYYPFPFIKIGKLFFHNFRKYGVMDFTYFKIFIKSIFEVLINIPRILKYRKPIHKDIRSKINNISALKF